MYTNSVISSFSHKMAFLTYKMKLRIQLNIRSILLILLVVSLGLSKTLQAQDSNSDFEDNKFFGSTSIEIALNFGTIENGELRYKRMVGENLVVRIGGWYERQLKSSDLGGGQIHQNFSRITVVPGVEWRFKLRYPRLQPYIGIIVPVQVQNARQRFENTDGQVAVPDYETTLKNAWSNTIEDARTGNMTRRAWTHISLRPLAGLDFSITPAWYIGAEGSFGSWFQAEFQPKYHFNPAIEPGIISNDNSSQSYRYELFNFYGSIKTGLRF